MDTQFFKPPPTATNFTPPPPLPPPPRQNLPPQQMGVGGMTDSTGRLLLPHEVYIPQPPMSQPPYMGGVQLEPRVLFSSTPGIPPPPSHKPNIIKPRNDFTALKNVIGFNGPPDSTNGMMIPLLIDGGILLVILLR